MKNKKTHYFIIAFFVIFEIVVVISFMLGAISKVTFLLLTLQFIFTMISQFILLKRNKN